MTESSFLNESLDATASLYLLFHADHLGSALYCNKLVDLMVEWLRRYKTWPEYVKFKGRTLRSETDLDIVARYYVALARSEAELWKLKESSKNWNDFDVNLRETENAAALLQAFASGLNCKPRRTVMSTLQLAARFNSEEPFSEGNKAADLMFNLAISIGRYVAAVNSIRPSVGFPTLHSYDDIVKEHERLAFEELAFLKKEIVERREALLLRMRFDHLTASVQYLENQE